MAGGGRGAVRQGGRGSGPRAVRGRPEGGLRAARGATVGTIEGTMPDPDIDLTELLRAVSSGERGDLDRLLHALYDDLRRLAVHHMQSERNDHTLQPTALVHEAYLRLIDQRSTDWADRLHFFAMASRIIRRILVDHARGRDALKRGGGRARLELVPEMHVTEGPDVDLVALDEALAELGRIDERQARVVELRFFGGLGIDEVAELLSIGRRSVNRDWQIARAWLHDRLYGEGEGDADGDSDGDGGSNGDRDVEGDGEASVPADGA